MDVGGLPLHFEDTKTDRSRRTVVLPALAVQALNAHRRRQAEQRLAAGPDWQDEDLIFSGPAGGPVRQARTREAFYDLLARAELPRMRIYDLRHSCATLLLEAGEDLKVVSERLGHANIALTADVYSHVTEGLQERTAAKLDKMLGDGG